MKIAKNMRNWVWHLFLGAFLYFITPIFIGVLVFGIEGLKKYVPAWQETLVGLLQAGYLLIVALILIFGLVQIILQHFHRVAPVGNWWATIGIVWALISLTNTFGHTFSIWSFYYNVNSYLSTYYHYDLFDHPNVYGSIRLVLWIVPIICLSTAGIKKLRWQKTHQID